MRLAQELPGGATGASPPGAEAMPTAGPPAGGGSMPGAEGQAAPPTFKIIYSPLDSVGKILADLDFKTYLENNFGTDPDVLAHKIWIMYGGSQNELSPGKKGERSDTPASNEPMQSEQIQTQEYNNTRNSRWKRLPRGISIEEITNTQAISNAITGGYQDLSKQLSKPATASLKKWLKLSNQADNLKNYKYADYIDMVMFNVHPLR